MKNDAQIQNDVMEELGWDPVLHETKIAVTVKNGIVTLSGQVDSYAKKLAAEKDAGKISGVLAVADGIQLCVVPSTRRSDSEIAEAAVSALKWHSGVDQERIKITVADGNVQLEGEVDWDYQRKNAKAAIENICGVRSVLSLIKIKPGFSAPDIRQKINAAFHRAATIDAAKINVEVFGGKVILSGTVRSLAEKEDAELAAWNAPGVTGVESRLGFEAPEFVLEE